MKNKMKKLKGFTLIELIIVMALMVSILTAILQLMDPVQEAYRDSTIYEQQRTVENSIISYIAESTRYAKAISILDQGVNADTDKNGSGDFNIANLQSAANYFIDKNNLKAADYPNIQVIVIDRSTEFEYKNTTVKGRIIRIKGLPGGNAPTWGSTVTESDLQGSDWNTAARYVAMGPSYYGDMSFDIILPNDWLTDTDSDGNLDPDNQLKRGFDIQVSMKTPKKSIQTSTTGSVTNMNYFVTADIIDYQTFIPTPSTGTLPAKVTYRQGALAGKDSHEEADTYIFFLRPDVS